MPPVIGIVFDFDDTLAPDSTSGFLASIGVDVDHFWTSRVHDRLEQGWDPIPAYLHEMIVESRSRDDGARVTRDELRAFGSTIEFFPGVREIFDTLRETAREVDGSIDVEFYVISSGIGEILRATTIADRFTDIWASEFHYNEADEIDAMRSVVSFTEKTRFLFQISKGLVGERWRRQVAAVNRRVEFADFRIPFRRMIVVGDGQTDVPCFSLIKRYEGVPIAVCDLTQPSRWDKARLLMLDRRVETVYAADFRPDGGLHKHLRRAIGEIAQRIVEEGSGS
jgi:phosphoserine phosphatase